ncbi:hypothetical protein Tco_0846471 [Tanacetum coccineum]
MNMNEAIQVSCIIDKLPPSWKYFKHTLKHQKEGLTLVELGGHLRIEKSFRVQDNDKPKGNNVVGPSVVNMIEHNNSFRYNDNKGGKAGKKANGSGTNGLLDGSTNSLKGQNIFNKSLQTKSQFDAIRTNTKKPNTNANTNADADVDANANADANAITDANVDFNVDADANANTKYRCNPN